MVEILEYQAKSIGNKVTISFQNFTEDNYLVKSDKDRIMQVFLNLLNNALKFTFKGFILVTVTKYYDSIANSSRLEISVKDNGIGIRKEDQRKLFKLFGIVNRDHAKNNTNGIGLGLFISKQIINQFTGVIDVISEIDQGSDFYFSLPLEDIDTEQIQQNITTTLKVNEMFNQSFMSQMQMDHLRKSSIQFNDNHKLPQEQSQFLFPQILLVDDQIFNIEAIKVILKVSSIDL